MSFEYVRKNIPVLETAGVLCVVSPNSEMPRVCNPLLSACMVKTLPSVEQAKIIFPHIMGEAKKLPSTRSLHRVSPDFKSIALAMPASLKRNTKLSMTKLVGT